MTALKPKKTRPQARTCKHPPTRLYSWWVRDCIT